MEKPSHNISCFPSELLPPTPLVHTWEIKLDLLPTLLFAEKDGKYCLVMSYLSGQLFGLTQTNVTLNIRTLIPFQLAGLIADCHDHPNSLCLKYRHPFITQLYLHVHPSLDS